METMKLEDKHLIDDLNVVCNSLGSLDVNDGTYMKDRDCKPCLREILRYLSADTKDHRVRSHLGRVNIIKSDLIYLISQYCDYHEGDPDMFTIIMRLCTNLTVSTLLLFENQEIPTEIEKLKVYNDLQMSLYRYKEAFATNERIWSTLNVHLSQNTDDEIMFERLVILIRNILHIPVDTNSDMGCPSDFDAHDMCLYRMDKSGMLNTIIKICSESEKGAEFCFHFIEVIYLMLRNQNPATLAASKPYSLKRKLDESDPDKKRLHELIEIDRRERDAKISRLSAIRFKSGAFTVTNRKTIGGAPAVIFKLGETFDQDKNKTELRKARNRKPLSSESSLLTSDTNMKTTRVTYSLKVFCRNFVSKVYNAYMQQIKHNLIQRKTQENDESYYLWALQYFTSFTRHSMLPISNISETLSTSTLHYISILISEFQEKLKIEKKKFNDISKRLHLAVRAYREILSLIRWLRSRDTEYSETVQRIEKNIFSENEYSLIILNLFNHYEEHKHSRHYLEDLITTNDIFIDLMEEFANTGSDKFNCAKTDGEKEDDSSSESENPDNDTLEGSKKVDEAPVDENLMVDNLVTGDSPNEDNNTGENEESVRCQKKKSKNKSKEENNEKDIRSTSFISRYCNPDIIKSYITVLKNHKTNDKNLNTAILKFFKRIVYDCKQEVLLFQASVFRCLLEIMEYPGREDFVPLSKYLIEKFGSMANKKRWMYQELLFWKTINDCAEIELAIDPPVCQPEPDLSQEDVDQEGVDLFDDEPIGESQGLNDLLNSPRGSPNGSHSQSKTQDAEDDTYKNILSQDLSALLASPQGSPVPNDDDQDDDYGKLPSDPMVDLMAELNASDLSDTDE